MPATKKARYGWPKNAPLKAFDATEEGDGMSIVVKVAKEHRFGTFVRGKFAMYEHMLQLRNKAVESIMARHCNESEDPALSMDVPQNLGYSPKLRVQF